MISRLLFVITSCSTEPLGLMYLSSSLWHHGYSVKLTKYSTDDALYKFIQHFGPGMICFSMTTGQHVALLKIAEKVKKWFPNIKIIIGGAHPTYFPRVAELSYIDYMIRGEADISFPNLLNRLNHGYTPESKDCSDLILPVDLDRIPFPDRELIKGLPEYDNCKMKNVMTSRGCPYNCSYCYALALREVYNGQKIVRYRSPANVVAECFLLVKNYGARMIFFIDDEFSMNVGRLWEIKEMYKGRVDVPFHCQVRIDLLDEERVKILKEMGCYSLTFAIESGDEGIRRKLLNRRVTDEQILNGVALLKKYDIKFRAENMIGLPHETFAQIKKTLNLNIKVRPDYAWCSIYQPYPGTKLGDYCLDNGLFDGKVDLIAEKFAEDTVLNMSADDKNKLLNWQRLFGLVVEFPILKILLLWKIRRKKVLTKLRDWWKLYCYKNRLFRGTI